MSMELMNREQEKVSNGSLRSLVSSNTDMLHRVGSKLGELGAVRKEVSEFAKQVIVNNEVIILQLQTLVNNDVDERNLLMGEFKKVMDAVVVAQKNTVGIFNMVKKEIAERERVEKKVDEEMKQLKLAINEKVKRQRYLWLGVGVLVVGLVCSLGYLCLEVRKLTGKIEEMQVNIESRMTEVRKNVLTSGVNKAVEAKPASIGKGKNK